MEAKMKTKLLSLMLIILLVFTSCSGVSVDKGMSLLDDGEIDEAIEVFETITDQDETNFEAWFGIVEALMEDEEYEDAEEVLEEIYDVIEDNYDEEDEDVDYEDVMDELTGYADDLIDEEIEMGEWYTEAIPLEVDISYLDGMTYFVDEAEYLAVPDGATLYYNFSGDKVTTDDEEYDEDDGIVFEEEGEFDLVVAVINDIGIKGEESEATITVIEGNNSLGGNDPEDPGTTDPGTTDPGTVDPEITDPNVTGENTIISNYASGTYDSTITIEFSGYDTDNYDLSVYYTLDGTSPLDTYDYEYYSSYDGIELPRGEYTLSAVMYDYTTSEYSDVVTYHYVIEKTPTSTDDIYIVAFDVEDDVYEELNWIVSDLRDYEGIDVYVDRAYDLDEVYTLLEGDMPPDFIYGLSTYAIELYDYIDDVTYYSDILSKEYYPNVLDSVFYYDAYYCVPVSIRPSSILYANYYDTIGYYENDLTWDNFTYEISEGSETYGFAYPQDDLLGLLSYYAGFGGDYQIDYASYSNFEYDPLVDAFSFIQYLSSTEANLKYSGINYQVYENALYDGDATFIMDSPGDYYSSNMSYNYEPVGSMPLPDDNVVSAPLEVYGLFVTLTTTSEKMSDIYTICEYIGNDDYYTYYLAGENYGLPAVKGMTDGYYYTPFSDVKVYEEIINTSSTMPLDLLDTLVYYTDIVDIFSAMDGVISGSLTPEEAATQIINDIDSLYSY